MDRKNRETNTYLALAAIIFFHFLSSLIWLKMDQSYLKLDAWGHFRYSLEVYNALKDILHFKFKLFLNTIEPLNWYGILVGFITAPFYSVFGSSQDTAIMISNSVFLAILVSSTYGIGKKLFNIRAGLLAAFILTFYPVIFNNLRTYMLDLPLTSMVALSLYFLFVSDNLSNRKNSLLFAFSMMLGFLVKLNYLAFIAGPLVITFYRTNKQKPLFSNNALRRTFYLIILAVLLCAVFYLGKSKDMLQHIYGTSYMGLFRNYSFRLPEFLAWKLSWLLKYLEASIAQGISFLFLTAFIAGFVFFIRLRLKDRWLLYLVLLIPLLAEISLFSIYPSSMVRYNMPFLPVIAVISSIGLLNITNKVYRAAFLSLLIVFGIIQFFAVSYGINCLPKEIKLSFLTKKPHPFNLVIFQQNTEVNPFLKDKTSFPSTADWKSIQAFKAIRNSNTSGERIQVLSLSNVPELIETMEYQILKERLLVDLMPVFSASLEDFLQKRHAPLDMVCKTADYILISDNMDSVWEKSLKTTGAARKRIQSARKIFYENIGSFQLIEKIGLPDGSNLSIYKNISNPSLNKKQEIKKGDIRLLFDGGRIRIFRSDVEITKGLGLYTSLFSLQHWRDSMEATWEVKKLSEIKLTATGRWMFIPVTQIWEIEIREGNVIHWQVKSLANDAIKIETEDYKLMLSDKYKEWFVSSGEAGKFADYFENNLWKKFWEGDIKNEIGVRQIDIADTYLPEVRFHAYQVPREFLASIENSDQLFNGRVIGCYKTNSPLTNLFAPGQYKYFEVEISVE